MPTTHCGELETRFFQDGDGSSNVFCLWWEIVARSLSSFLCFFVCCALPAALRCSWPARAPFVFIAVLAGRSGEWGRHGVVEEGARRAALKCRRWIERGVAWRCCTCRRQKDAIFLSFEQQEKHFNIFENYFPYQLIPCMPLGGQRQRQRWPKNKNNTKQKQIELGKKRGKLNSWKLFVAHQWHRVMPRHTHTHSYTSRHTHADSQPHTPTHSLSTLTHACWGQGLPTSPSLAPPVPNWPVREWRPTPDEYRYVACRRKPDPKLTPSAANPLSHIGFPYRTAYLGFCYGVSLSPSLGTPSCGLSHFPRQACREKERVCVTAHAVCSCLLSALASCCLLLSPAAFSCLILPPLASFCLFLPSVASCCLLPASFCLLLPSFVCSCLLLPDPCLHLPACLSVCVGTGQADLSLTHTLT